ncbi:30S ribosome-binding factor RbfA [bacterium]|nr:30S ribosome-binding factor RbfA [bacterium]
MSIRQERVAREIQRGLARVMDQMAPRLLDDVMVTVIDVDVTADLGVAKVYLGFLNTSDKQKCLEILDFHNKEIRKNFASGPGKSMKKVPEFRFFLDDTIDNIERIDKLLRNLK